MEEIEEFDESGEPQEDGDPFDEIARRTAYFRGKTSPFLSWLLQPEQIDRWIAYLKLEINRRSADRQEKKERSLAWKQRFKALPQQDQQEEQASYNASKIAYLRWKARDASLFYVISGRLSEANSTKARLNKEKIQAATERNEQPDVQFQRAYRKGWGNAVGKIDTLLREGMPWDEVMWRVNRDPFSEE